jgi:hypothetical protein
MRQKLKSCVGMELVGTATEFFSALRRAEKNSASRRGRPSRLAEPTLKFLFGLLSRPGAPLGHWRRVGRGDFFLETSGRAIPFQSIPLTQMNSRCSKVQ